MRVPSLFLKESTDCTFCICVNLGYQVFVNHTPLFVVYLFQIYDAGDFSVLCSVISPRGERWLGGEFLAPDRVLIWTDEGKGYMYKLPAK